MTTLIAMRAVTAYFGNYSLPVWSADNQFVAFKTGDFNVDGPIYAMHANAARPVLLTFG